MTTRTPLTYYGGKQTIAEEIVALMPPHFVYLEPYCGGAAVLFAKPRSRRETLNDLDGAVVAFWRAARDHAAELAAAVELTPYSREEFARCRDGLDEEGVGDVERARRLMVTIDQSFTRAGGNWSPPSLASDRRGRWQAGTWQNVPEKVVAAADRLRGVALENRDAVELIPRYDLPEALIYADPPYAGNYCRDRANGKSRYRQDQPELWTPLVDALLGIEEATVILSGYPCPESDRLDDHGWRRIDLDRRNVARTRTGSNGGSAPETLWTNRDPGPGGLF